MFSKRAHAPTRILYAHVVIDLVQARIDRDRDEYARWSVRARMMMLDGAMSLIWIRGRLGPHRKGLIFRLDPATQRRARKREKYVRRAVPGAFVKALRSEMRGLVESVAYSYSYTWVIGLSRWRRFTRAVRAAWATWQERTIEEPVRPGPIDPPVPPRDRRVE